jgi:hypothetical protein
MPRLHIHANERVGKLAHVTQSSPRELGHWYIYWTSPELSQNEIERLQRAASRVLDAGRLKEGIYAVAPSEVRETLTGALVGEVVPAPDSAPAPIPSWLEQVERLTG